MTLKFDKDPKYNVNINPKYNVNINPVYNVNINPKYNVNINPKYNININPNYNVNINPKYNSNINPKYNIHINPKFNTQINPKYNRLINPNYSPNFTGFVHFDLNNNIIGFTVEVQGIILFFNSSNESEQFAIKHSQNGYVLFDYELNFIGHIESNLAEGYNLFDNEDNWKSFLLN